MTDNFEKKVAVDGPVVNAGELGSSTFSPGQALPAGPLGLGQRWSVADRATLRASPTNVPAGANHTPVSSATLKIILDLNFLPAVEAERICRCSAPGSLDTSLSHAAGLIEITACHA